MRVMLSVTAALVCLGLAACAGAPPPGQKVAAGKPVPCERFTGSLLCGSHDDLPFGNLNIPPTASPKVNETFSEAHPGR